MGGNTVYTSFIENNKLNLYRISPHGERRSQLLFSETKTIGINFFKKKKL